MATSNPAPAFINLPPDANTPPNLNPAYEAKLDDLKRQTQKRFIIWLVCMSTIFGFFVLLKFF